MDDVFHATRGIGVTVINGNVIAGFDGVAFCRLRRHRVQLAAVHRIAAGSVHVASGNVGDFVASVVETRVGQADRVAAARRGDGDAVGIGDGFVACGVGGGGAARIRYSLVARRIFNRDLAELDLVFGSHGDFVVGLGNADVFTGIHGNGFTGVNQLGSGAAHAAAGGGTGGEGETGAVNGVGDVAGGKQFAGIGGRRRGDAAVGGGGKRSGVGFQAAVGGFGDGGAVGFDCQVIHGCARDVGARSYAHAAVAGFDFGFGGGDVVVDIAQRGVQLSAVDGVFAVCGDGAVRYVGDFLIACINTGFGYAGPAVDGQAVIVDFAIAGGYAVYVQVFFQTDGNRAVAAHLGLDVATVVIAKRTGARALNGQCFIGLNGFVVGGNAGSVAVGGDFETSVGCRIDLVQLRDVHRIGVFCTCSDILQGNWLTGIAADQFDGVGGRCGSIAARIGVFQRGIEFHCSRAVAAADIGGRAASVGEVDGIAVGNEIFCRAVALYVEAGIEHIFDGRGIVAFIREITARIVCRIACYATGISQVTGNVGKHGRRGGRTCGVLHRGNHIRCGNLIAADGRVIEFVAALVNLAAIRLGINHRQLRIVGNRLCIGGDGDFAAFLLQADAAAGIQGKGLTIGDFFIIRPGCGGRRFICCRTAALRYREVKSRRL